MRLPFAPLIVALIAVLTLCGCSLPEKNVPLSESQINAAIGASRDAIERIDQPLMPAWYKRQLVPYIEIHTVKVETPTANEIREVPEPRISSPFLGYIFFASNVVWLLLLFLTPVGRRFVDAVEVGSEGFSKYFVTGVVLSMLLASWFIFWPIQSSIVRITPETTQAQWVVVYFIGIISIGFLIRYRPGKLGKAAGALLVITNALPAVFALIFIVLAYILTAGKATPWHYALSLGYIFLDTLPLLAISVIVIDPLRRKLARYLSDRHESRLLVVSQKELTNANAKRLIGEIGSHFDLLLIAKSDQETMVIEDNVNQAIDKLSEGQMPVGRGRGELSGDIKDLLIMIERNGWQHKRFAVRLKRRFGDIV